MTEWAEDALARLRSAVARGDGAAGLGVLRGRDLMPVLQYAGDALVAALAQGVPGAEAPARECLNELEGRGLPGDPELAAEVAAALGARPASGLAELPVDLAAVAAAMDDGFQVLDLRRGDVLPAGEPPDGLPIPPDALPGGEDARRGWARRWLAEQGFRPVPRRL
ncbi:hypothetical protein E1281_32470 [Actinomadura sp. KC345]|uniref:hypothetical protein n=1 Tax=Actinomadura sp. KC345 TaxID=2530371 RepID=UPI001048EB1C|nr:hypothetical protein [Actinomadura sp. KC345]TDC44833.1 hypothetical protein E1281_32470 [Actinomadura sp. KC345]